jgi:chemotaxis protein CheX
MPIGTMMNLEVVKGEMPWTDSGDRLTSAVQVSGTWNGVFVLECSREQACRFAGRFLTIDAPAAVDEEVLDVMGELANMVGGNMKCLMAQGSLLSMPVVVQGSSAGLRFCGGEVQDRLAFQCDEGPFWVTVLATISSSSVAHLRAQEPRLSLA